MVETSATSRSFPGWDAVPEDIIPDVDDTRDLGSEEKNWAALWVVLALVTSITIGGIVNITTIDSWLFINASTEVNGSINISEDLFVDGTITAGALDIQNLTVENMNFTNLTITGDIFNISVTETYVNDLFPNEYCTSDLGSIGLRWDNGYFCHNVSAEYFVGDGSFLTNLPAGTEYDPHWTGNQSSYFNTTDILGFNYWNDTYATFNKTYADTLYATWANVVNGTMLSQATYNTNYSTLMLQSTWNTNYTSNNAAWLNTTNSTYDAKVSFPGWDANLAWENQTNIFTANQNLTAVNISAIECMIFDSGGKICSGV